MAKRTRIGIEHRNENLGTPSSYTRQQLDVVKAMVSNLAQHTMGGIQNIVKKGDKVLIKINTVIPSPPENGFTTDPRILEAVIELVKDQNPAQILIGERSALGGDTLKAMQVCGIKDVADRTGAVLCPFDKVTFDTYKIDRPIVFNEFPVPRPVNEADVYIGLPKWKVHIHTQLTCALKLQFGNLPDYDWMTRCHRDDIYQKIANLTKAANPTWFVTDSLYACQGNGPFSPYPEDLIKNFNTIVGGSDPVAVDTVCEAIMDWENPGHIEQTQAAAADGLGTNKLEEIDIIGWPIDKVRRKFKKRDIALQGVFPNVHIIMGAVCEPGCRALVRMALDQVYIDGTLTKLKKPLTIFTGLQFEPLVKNVKGPVVVYGDCAKKMLEYYPNAAFWGENAQYPNCAPIWSNVSEIGLADYIRSLEKV